MGRLGLAVVSGLLLVAECVSPPAARASCASAVVVDGTVLFGSDASGLTLPPPDGRRRAVAPACNDAGQDSPDGTTTVVRFKSVPADVAVRSPDGDTVYLAEGSLTALSAHPLHQQSRRVARRDCGRERKLEGTAGVGGSDSVTLVSGGRERFVRDLRTRLVNRPAYQPVRRGQRLRVTATRCRNRLIANGIAFTGPTVVAESYRPQRGQIGVERAPWGLLAVGSICLALAGFTLRRLFRG